MLCVTIRPRMLTSRADRLLTLEMVLALRLGEGMKKRRYGASISDSLQPGRAEPLGGCSVSDESEGKTHGR